MSKIKTITLKNFKAIAEQNASFNGCSAIITAGNNKGKTSFLRGIVDRIRFIRPEVKVRQGEKEGSGELELTDGSKFVWKFDDGKKDTLQFITHDGSKKSVTRELGARFFPTVFDIDKFLSLTPQKQTEELQKILGIDFSDINARYKTAYDERTEAKREYESQKAKLESMGEVPEVMPVDLTELQSKKAGERMRLNVLYESNVRTNQTTRKAWEQECRRIDEECQVFNEAEAAKSQKCNDAIEALSILECCGYNGREVATFIDELKSSIQPHKTPEFPKEPTYIAERPDDAELQEIDNQIITASETNQKAMQYTAFVNQKKHVEDCKSIAMKHHENVQDIEAERAKMIESVQMPKGIEITPDGITVDGLPLDRNQISTSKLYCSALRIASMNLGEVRTLYFDASFLDKNTLSEIEQWASANDLQLLIERPDFDGGEITYTLIEN